MPSDQDVYVGVEDLLVQLRIANRLNAVQVRARMSKVDMILVLAGTGASHQEIADLVGTTASTVSNALVRHRRKAAGKKAGRKDAQGKETDE